MLVHSGLRPYGAVPLLLERVVPESFSKNFTCADGFDLMEWIAGALTWLAQAELSTLSSVLRVLQRPIYLCHHFAFYTVKRTITLSSVGISLTLEEIEVRREVEVKALSFDPGLSASGEAFVGIRQLLFVASSNPETQSGSVILV
ncbi:hypothetical protein R3P38DRAFT_3168876 [Favolaschia claudopus]|uniref:Uncharacterized protein n=1 Tax=Favolaschia claudopus TaxID=2862362 RepID=A0AAW0E2U1_9AGAR